MNPSSSPHPVVGLEHSGVRWTLRRAMGRACPVLVGAVVMTLGGQPVLAQNVPRPRFQEGHQNPRYRLSVGQTRQVHEWLRDYLPASHLRHLKIVTTHPYLPEEPDTPAPDHLASAAFRDRISLGVNQALRPPYPLSINDTFPRLVGQHLYLNLTPAEQAEWRVLHERRPLRDAFEAEPHDRFGDDYSYYVNYPAQWPNDSWVLSSEELQFQLYLAGLFIEDDGTPSLRTYRAQRHPEGLGLVVPHEERVVLEGNTLTLGRIRLTLRDGKVISAKMGRGDEHVYEKPFVLPMTLRLRLRRLLSPPVPQPRPAPRKPAKRSANVSETAPEVYAAPSAADPHPTSSVPSSY